jgi:hypothetical protein
VAIAKVTVTSRGEKDEGDARKRRMKAADARALETREEGGLMTLHQKTKDD